MGRKRRSKSVVNRTKTSIASEAKDLNSKSLPIPRIKISRISLALRHRSTQQTIDNVETNGFESVAASCDCGKTVAQECAREEYYSGKHDRDGNDKGESEDKKLVEGNKCEIGTQEKKMAPRLIDVEGQTTVLIATSDGNKQWDAERRDSGRPVRKLMDAKPRTRKEQEHSQEEENDSPSEDDEDADWTPAGTKELRCTRRSTRVATLKSKQGVRQTRARARILTPQQSKRKRSTSGDIRKAPVSWLAPSSADSASQDEFPGRLNSGDKERACIDCSLKHQPNKCPLHYPVAVISDLPVPLKSNSESCMADCTLPKCLRFINLDKGHGTSIIALEAIQQYTQFGPLMGKHIEEADIHEDMDLRNIWEIFGNNSKRYLDTADPKCSNWLRYLRPAQCKSERNMSAISVKDNLYFVTVKDIKAGMELTYWAEDPTVSWSKKKIEKTSCGGCNQKFPHPLYYRMHCMIFHDPNYSLTIRKYHCKICGIAVLGKENIMRHASEMHEGKGAYQCQFCKKFFLRLNYLDMHRTYGCKLNPCRSRPLCELCGKKFCQPQKLKVHIRRMHSDISEVLKEFQCKSCFKLLGSRAALQRHLKEVHHKDQNIAATCDRCGKTFQNKSNLKIHMLTHSGVKPFR